VGLNRGLRPTGSLVERFGLFTIIVLGEVVFGVVDGISASARDVKTITTGIVALVIGFGFWWIYFDLVGRRLPRGGGRAQASWLLSHLPITMAITAAGAAMVSLIGHAHDARTPAATREFVCIKAGTTMLQATPAIVPPIVTRSGIMKCSKSMKVPTIRNETKIQYAIATCNGNLCQIARKRSAVTSSTAK